MKLEGWNALRDGRYAVVLHQADDRDLVLCWVVADGESVTYPAVGASQLQWLRPDQFVPVIEGAQ